MTATRQACITHDNPGEPSLVDSRTTPNTFPWSPLSPSPTGQPSTRGPDLGLLPLAAQSTFPPPHLSHCPSELPSISPMLPLLMFGRLWKRQLMERKRTLHNLRLRSIPGFACIFETGSKQTPDMFCESCGQTWTACAINRCLCQYTTLLWRRVRRQSHLQKAPDPNRSHAEIR